LRLQSRHRRGCARHQPSAAIRNHGEWTQGRCRILLDSGLVLLASANAHYPVNGADEDLAITDLKRTRSLLLVCVGALLFSPTCLAYDTELAKAFATMFESVQGQKAGAAMHLIKPEKLMVLLRLGEPVVTADVRTPAEANILGKTVPYTLAIAPGELFMPGNLERIPKDRRVVLVCKSGTLAVAAGTGLRMIGFDNVDVLKANAPGRNPIVSRILWLNGKDRHNSNTFSRLIDIHGTQEEWRLRRPKNRQVDGG
jgi:rhodanese-related sulfurtransferase